MDEEIKKALIRTIPFLLIVLGVAIAIKKKKFTKAELFISRPNSYAKVFVCWLGFVAFVFVTELILYRAGLLHVNQWRHEIVPSILRIIGMVILAPVAEELVFRAMFLAKLKQWKVNKHLAIIIQALIFVALHTGAFENTLQSNMGIFQRFTDAVIYAYSMYYTRSVLTPIALHATGNSVAVIEQFMF